MNLLITGVSGYMGQAVVAQLMQRNPFKRILGIDSAPPQMLGPVQYIPGKISDPELDLGDLLVMNNIQILMHLSYATRPSDPSDSLDELQDAQELMGVAEATGIKRLIFAGRDWVYASLEKPCDEEAPLLDAHSVNTPEISTKLKLEQLFRKFAQEQPEIEAVMVRLCHVLGPGSKQPLDAVLDLPWILGPEKADPRVHLLHIEDAAEIFLKIAEQEEIRGAINAAGVEPITLSLVAGILQKRLIRPPSWLMQALTRGLKRARLLSFDHQAIQQLHHGVGVSTARLKNELKFTPKYSTRQTLAMWRVHYKERKRR